MVRLWELPPDTARSSVLLSVLLPLTRAADDRARVALLREAYRRAAGHHDRPRALELGFWTGMLATLTRFGAEPRLDAILDLDIQRLTEVGEQLLAPEATIEAVVALAQRKG